MLAKTVGINSINIEIDAKLVLELIWESSEDNLKLKPIICDCRILLC